MAERDQQSEGSPETVQGRVKVADPPGREMDLGEVVDLPSPTRRHIALERVYLFLSLICGITAATLCVLMWRNCGLLTVAAFGMVILSRSHGVLVTIVFERGISLGQSVQELKRTVLILSGVLAFFLVVMAWELAGLAMNHFEAPFTIPAFQLHWLFFGVACALLAWVGNFYLDAGLARVKLLHGASDGLVWLELLPSILMIAVIAAASSAASWLDPSVTLILIALSFAELYRSFLKLGVAELDASTLGGSQADLDSKSKESASADARHLVLELAFEDPLDPMQRLDLEARLEAVIRKECPEVKQVHSHDSKN